MKKGILVLGACMVLLLCSVGVLVAGYFLYFRNTPEKAFAKAFDYWEDGDYYQYKASGTTEVSITIPSYPQFDEDYETVVTIEGKKDIQNNKSYSKSTTDEDGEKTSIEKYTIGSDVYISTDGDAFKKTSEEERDDESEKDLFNLLEDISEKEDYTVLAEEEVGNKMCYHYEIALTKEQIDEHTNLYSDVLEGIQFEIGSSKFEIWISKKDSRLAKFSFIVSDMTFSEESQDLEIEMEMIMDQNYSTTFTNWGEKVAIEAPI